MSKRDPNALAVPVRRATQPSTPSSRAATMAMTTTPHATAGRRGPSDEAGEPRDQHGADEGDLIGGTEFHGRNAL